MFGRTFYHSLLRKYVIVFGNLFNDIYVQRLDNSNNTLQTLKVPIAYGPKEKFLVRISQDPNLDQDVALSMPRLGFEIQAINYSSNRKLPSTHKHAKVLSTDKNRVTTQYRPVPYDITFILSCFVKNADDGAQIVEQIVPYFQPDWTTTLNLIPAMDNIKYDVPFVLNDITIEDTYEGDFATRRALIWNFTFTAKAYMFGPVSTTGIIKRPFINFYDDLKINDPDKVATIEKRPALTANGTPAYTVSNSVALEDIDFDDNYEILEIITEYE